MGCGLAGCIGRERQRGGSHDIHHVGKFAVARRQGLKRGGLLLDRRGDLVVRGLERMPHEYGGATLDGQVVQDSPASYYAAAERLDTSAPA